MNRSNIRNKLSNYMNGGNAFMLLDYLLELNQDVIEISQEDLAKELNKTRPSIKASLDLLSQIGIIQIKYRQIKISEEINEQ